MILNLYKIEWRVEESKQKKEKMMKYDNKVESSGEIKTVKQGVVER